MINKLNKNEIQSIYLPSGSLFRKPDLFYHKEVRKIYKRRKLSYSEKGRFQSTLLSSGIAVSFSFS